MPESYSDLTLSPLVEADAERLFGLVDHNRVELAKFWWERRTRQVADSLDFIRHANQDERDKAAISRGIRVDSLLVGVGGLHTIDWAERRAQVGYWIDKDHSGRGIATATVAGLAEYAFSDTLDLRELIIATRTTNGASQAIAEKSGFTLQAIEQVPRWHEAGDEPVPTAVYALTRDD